MRTLHGVANMFLLIFIIGQVLFNINQVQDMNKDLNSARLQTAIDNSTKFAFSNSLRVSDLEQTYEDLNSFTVDPTNIVEDFSIMLLKCYGIAETKDNLSLVEQYIDGAVLCDNDGYYLLEMQSTPYAEFSSPAKYTVQMLDAKENGSASIEVKEYDKYIESNKLMWSVKYPYYFEKDGYHFALSLTNSDTVVMKGDLSTGNIEVARENGERSLETIKETIHHDGKTYEVDKNVYTWQYRKPFTGNFYSQDEMNDSIKLRAINLLIGKRFNNSISQIAEARGRDRQYTVYLPTETTRKGVNPIRNTSLLVAMSEIPFAPGARLVEPSLAGYTAVTKQYIVGFKNDKDGGTYEYCYAAQLPKEISSDSADKLETFYSMTEAAKAGYQPALEYITRPIIR